MNINQYLDSTYLKTPQQAEITEEKTWEILKNLADNAIEHNIFAVMIRPNYVAKMKDYLKSKNQNLTVGTVIGFHEGTYSLNEKIEEAKKAIEDGADELDFVINYEAYLSNHIDLVKNEVIEATKLCLENKKIAKWIIEIAALSDEQIADLTLKISQWVSEHFPSQEEKVFVKSSTGFYKTKDGKPNGATFEGIEIMLKNAGKLPVKAAGGVRTPEDAKKMINLGVKRIGTSSALALLGNEHSENENY